MKQLESNLGRLRAVFSLEIEHEKLIQPANAGINEPCRIGW